MRVVVVTKIFPSSLEPLSAPFNRQQIAALASLCDVEVLAAIPHVPLARALSVPARAARLASLPARERIDGVPVTYVRQLYLPRIGLPVAVPLYLASLVPYSASLQRADVVLATWAYPDGCAAALAARAFGKPCAVKVHGSDVNVVLRKGAARHIAARLLPLADALVAVSRPLGSELVRLGVPGDRVHEVRNGIDASLFHPRDRVQARRELGVPPGARVVLFVGRLEPQKGIGTLLDAFDGVRTRVPGSLLVLAGDGVSTADVRRRTSSWGESVRLLGPTPHARVATWMGACDVLTLPSLAEGTPNVVLEALASGRPVVASSVGGIGDLLGDPRAGLLVPPRDARALADALVVALETAWDESAVRARGPRSWAESAAALLDVLQDALDRRAGRPPTRRPIDELAGSTKHAPWFGRSGGRPCNAAPNGAHRPARGGSPSSS
jgi:glycosyltransferase involved in cell wall biosynthesis